MRAQRVDGFYLFEFYSKVSYLYSSVLLLNCVEIFSNFDNFKIIFNIYCNIFALRDEVIIRSFVEHFDWTTAEILTDKLRKVFRGIKSLIEHQ